MKIRAILSAFGGLLLSDVMTLDYNKTGPVFTNYRREGKKA